MGRTCNGAEPWTEPRKWWRHYLVSQRPFQSLFLGCPQPVFFSLVNSCPLLPDFATPGWFVQKPPRREEFFIFKWVLFHSRIEWPASDVFSRLLQCQCACWAGKEKPTNSPSPPSAWALTAWSGNDLAGNLVLSFPAWASLGLSKMWRKHIVISRHRWLPKKKQTPLGGTFSSLLLSSLLHPRGELAKKWCGKRLSC